MILALVAMLEGFSTLAVEVLAIRLALPVTGGSSILTGVFLSVILLALSAGYWQGGVLLAHLNSSQISSRVSRNLLMAAAIYGLVSFRFEALMLQHSITSLGLEGGVLLTALGLYFLPVYLASQTIPLLTQLQVNTQHAGVAAGQMLFFSTLGSVVGGTLTPVVLFQTIGVAWTGVFCCVVLLLAALLFRRSFHGPSLIASLLICAVLIPLAAPSARAAFRFDSAYQSFGIFEGLFAGRQIRAMTMNGRFESGIVLASGQNAFEYADRILESCLSVKSRAVAVIGAAGFVLPEALVQIGAQVTAVDVDPNVKRIAEQQFYRRPLDSRIRFVVASARQWLALVASTSDRPDTLIMDAFLSTSVPSELLTVEAFNLMKRASPLVVMNVVTDAELNSAFSMRVLASARQAWGLVFVQKVGAPGGAINLLVSNRQLPGYVSWSEVAAVYTDDRNSIEADRLELFRSLGI